MRCVHCITPHRMTSLTAHEHWQQLCLEQAERCVQSHHITSLHITCCRVLAWRRDKLQQLEAEERRQCEQQARNEALRKAEDAKHRVGMHACVTSHHITHHTSHRRSGTGGRETSWSFGRPRLRTYTTSHRITSQHITREARRRQEEHDARIAAMQPEVSQQRRINTERVEVRRQHHAHKLQALQLLEHQRLDDERARQARLDALRMQVQVGSVGRVYCIITAHVAGDGRG